MVVLVLLLKKRVKISEVKSVVGVVVRRHKDTNSDLIVNVFVYLVLLVVVLFFLLQNFLQRIVLVFSTIVKLVMIKDEFALEVDVMDDLHESDGSLEFGFFESVPFTIWQRKHMTRRRVGYNVFNGKSELVKVSWPSLWWNSVSWNGSYSELGFILFLKILFRRCIVLICLI
jgi:hypothetical protein